MSVQRGVRTPQDIPKSGRIFIIEDASGPPCYRDRWGEWTCGHDHTPSVPLEEQYQWVEGWTAQESS